MIIALVNGLACIIMFATLSFFQISSNIKSTQCAAYRVQQILNFSIIFFPALTNAESLSATICTTFFCPPYLQLPSTNHRCSGDPRSCLTPWNPLSIPWNWYEPYWSSLTIWHPKMTFFVVVGTCFLLKLVQHLNRCCKTRYLLFDQLRNE